MELALYCPRAPAFPYLGLLEDPRIKFVKIHRNGQRLPSSLDCSAEGSRNSWQLVATTLQKPVWIRGVGVGEAE